MQDQFFKELYKHKIRKVNKSKLEVTLMTCILILTTFKDSITSM